MCVMNENMTYTDILKEEFTSRSQRNSRYSLRSFARDLEISPSRLSEIISEKGGLSEKMAKKICEKLELSVNETETFLALVNSKHARSAKVKKAAKEYLAFKQKKTDYRALSIDGFKLVSDWYHFAIITVMDLDDCDGTVSWVSKRLGLDYETVETAMDRLERLEILEFRDGRYFALETDITTTHDIESKALRSSHQQSLLQAIDALDEVPVELRDITSMTMAIDVNKMKEAKEKIKQFRREMCDFLESGDKNEVYNINIQLVPVTKRVRS